MANQIIIELIGSLLLGLLEQHLLVAGCHFLCFLKHLLGIGEHVTRFRFQGFGGERDAATLSVEIDDHPFI